jgi:hypothetical protein
VLDDEIQTTRPRPCLRIWGSPARSANADLVGALLDAYHGNHRQVIEALLDDADFLREQLHIASCLMSKGIGRGWRPKYERV